MTYTPPRSEPIAIVGSGCRFPGHSSTPSKLWDLLANPRDISKEVPENRFKIAGFYHSDGEYHGTTNAAKSYWLEENHRVFDASFFNITPKEAEAIDPQQKILLEVVYEAMESAGFSMQDYSGKKVSCYVGTMTADFDGLTQRDEQTFSQYCATGTSRALISNRISYFFNWQGASMTIDTACSSSLVAIHQAVLGLRGGETSVACVAGANVMLGPENFIAEASLHMLSPTGKSRMWDADADGYARGEGVAAVFLKTLSQALADGDEIEGLIRESGVNSDGRTKGITMPSSESQAALIEDTYRRSGLDPRNPLDRCQYFEAHGTGTQAGDPQEAAAICKSFFGDPEVDSDDREEAQILFVGSIKTIIGHPEGAAGIAGLLKAVLAMKHKTIPPNQHLKTLNPSVAPYYKHLKVPIAITEWPSAPHGQPLRASVNSFGFGGTNAHAILERYEPSIHNQLVKWQERKSLPTSSLEHSSLEQKLKIPLLFTANSENALISIVEKYSIYLKSNSSVDLPNLAWTLAYRRTHLPHRIAFTGRSQDEIVAKMDKQLKKISETPGAGFGARTKTTTHRARVLGIFTGQGAQWACMSKQLVLSSQFFSKTIDRLQRFLDECSDPPSWSIRDQLSASPSESRLSEAALSQPLCTALQIALIDLIRAAGVEFSAVVGHSSGEIGAAYAAGVLTAKDAMLIAYYRGVHAKLAGSADGGKGSMMAAGLDVEAAIDFCDQPNLRGRVCIAASNAPASVTLSGDLEAIEEAKTDLDNRQKFSRLLKVDTAYHSHHMDRCAKAYMNSLKTCHIQARKPKDNCVWISSVYGPAGVPSTDELNGRYWRENMTQAVLFNEALDRVLQECGPFDSAIEIGPHPALKGPATQTMKDVVGSALAYHGTLDRAEDDVVAFADCLAFLWSQPTAASIDFESYAATFSGSETIDVHRVVKDLPSYPWDHAQNHYRESRLARQYLNKAAIPHELLGIRTPDDSNQEYRWRNILKPTAITWLNDHRFQGQIIVPAAAYCVMALDAGRTLAEHKTIQMIEIHDLEILNAISVGEDSQGVETMFSLKPTLQGRFGDDGEIIEATFMLTSTAVDGNLPMREIVSGRLSLIIGEMNSDLLPPRPQDKSEMNPVDLDSFYSSMQDIGLGYSGPFRALLSMERRMNVSSATLEKPHPMDPCKLPVRPALLDVCFQATFAAFAAPGDGALWTSFLPQRIRRLRFNLALCEIRPGQKSMLDIDAYVTEFNPTTAEKQANFSGDIEVFNDKGQMEMQIEGINVASFATSTEKEDRELYLHTVWNVDPFHEIVCAPNLSASAIDHDLIDGCQRVARFYLSKLENRSPLKSLCTVRDASFTGLDFGFSSVGTGESFDTPSSIDQLIQASTYQASLNFLKSCGESMPSMIPGILDHVIREGVELSQFNHQLRQVVKQIAHRFPRMKVLEIASDQTATISLLQALGSSFASYTFAAVDDEPSDQFLKMVKDSQGKILHKEFDVHQDALDQGYIAQSYDLVIASYTLRKAGSFDDMLKGIQRIVRPGGFFLALDSKGELLRQRFLRLVSGLSQPSTPWTPIEWDQALASAGFGGSPRTFNQFAESLSLTICQSVDEGTRILRKPLQCKSNEGLSGNLLIIGGKKDGVKSIAQQIIHSLALWKGQITTVDAFETIDSGTLDTTDAAIILADLDEPIIMTMNAQKLQKLQKLFGPNRKVLWLVSGSRADNPHHNASVGIGRCIKNETPNLDLQFLDLDVIEASSTLISEAFLRLIFAGSSTLENQLWTTEHEIAVENSRILIPRMLPLESPNDRLNSIRRVVTTEVNTLESVVEIVGAKTCDGILHRAKEARGDDIKSSPAEGWVKITVGYSSLLAIKFDESLSLHVCLGRNAITGGTMVALAPENKSTVTVPTRWTHPIKVDSTDEETFLGLIIRLLVVQSMMSPKMTGNIILYESDDLLVFAIKTLFSDDSRRVLCFTSDPYTDGDMLYVNPRSSERRIRSLIPPNTSAIFDLSTKDSSFSKTLKESLPSSCHYYPRSTLFQPLANGNSNFEPVVPMTRLKAAISLSQKSGTLHSIPKIRPRVTPVRCSIEQGVQSLFEIANWKQSRSIPIIQTQVDPSTVFSSSKTYLLVGLTGELGQSLCKMMVLSGVRYIVVASRSPNRTPKWRDNLEALGAIVRIETMDVTEIADVERLRDSLAITMPPVAGVVNGAMVLSDGLFADMSLESFEKVLRPKAHGSMNLDKVFSSSRLDFFIMFSSLTALTGNRGQGNYAAANMHMAGLAAQRRKRGLAASVLDIGMLYGIGYINRTEGADIYNNLRKQGYRAISEQDIHHMFIETIIAGNPRSGHVSQLTTGLQRFSISDKQPWHFNPKFSHHTLKSVEASESDAGATNESVKQQLRNTASADEAAETLRRCFAAQLEVMLQLAPNSINKDIPIIELGVDSLVAVEIRSWFLGEVEKDMPVLKVLGGSSLADLCDELAVEIYSDSACSDDVIAESSSESNDLIETLTSKAGSTGVATPLTMYSDDLVDEELPYLTDKLYQTTAKMSYGQARLWFPYLYLEDKTAYNCTTSYQLQGSLDVVRFENSIQSVIQRYQAFRTSFCTDASSGNPIQAVSSSSPFNLDRVSRADEGEDIRRETEKVAKHIYDLESGDVFIATLLTHNSELHTIVFGYHHIIIDAVSWQFFLQDVEKFYSSTITKLEPASKYTDFAVKQRRFMESGGAQDKRSHWRSEFADLPPTLPLFPFSKVNTRKNLVRYNIKEYLVFLDPQLVASVKQASSAAKTTTFHFYLAVLQVLLHRFLNIDDICIGIADANRTDPAFMQTVGFLLDSLPLRFKINQGEPFIDRLHNTRSQVYAALGNSGIPLDVILEDLNISTASDALPLFQVLVNYRMGALKQKTMGDLKLDFLAYEDAKHPFDFILSIDEDEGVGALSLSMQEYLYDQAGGDLFQQTYVHLLEAFSYNVNQRLDECALFDERQREPSLALSTGPKFANDWPETLSLRVDSMVELNPGTIAIKDSTGAAMTYSQMAERTDSIALQLHAAGASNGTRVALHCEPCADAICSLLAILRIGAVYVPLDVRNSNERLSTILNESNASIVITHSMTRSRTQKLKSYNSTMFDISSIETTNTTAVPNRSNASSPAFVMFTSGSTGKPKGIVLNHSNFLTHIMAATERMGIKKERVLQQSAFGYDASLAQIFYALANGGTLVVSSNRQEMSELAALILREEISLTLCAPSEYTVLFKFGESFLSRCNSWRIAMCGGEAFPSHLRSRFFDLRLPQLEVFNAYGPTEISVASNIGPVDYRNAQQDNDFRVPIGKPMANYASYILDENAQLAPLGWVGELCVAGPAVASGYLRNEALTKAKFIADAISRKEGHISANGWERIYRTGDKGRMLSSGEIEYRGRIDGDSQVKIRGIRIELDDIASTLVRTSEKTIVNAAVVARDDLEQLLVAYVVFDSEKTPSNPAGHLKQFLQDLPLPVYMRPAIAVSIDQLPMNASGKLDVRKLKALPLPKMQEAGADSSDLTEAQMTMKEIWEGVLPHTGLEIGKSSNFFSVGGNSLLLLALQAEIRNTFEKEVTLPELFQINTLEALVRKVHGDEDTSTDGVAGSVALEPAIDWEAETSLTPSLASSVGPAKAQKPHKGPLTVVLTGATGFLGRHILQHLEASKQILHIHCVAVRQHLNNIALTLSNTSRKISYHAGDLSLPLLGLQEDEARLIFSSVDAIIHNGADVSFMQTYHALRKPNVEATKELVGAIADRHIPFHYVSTAGIAHLSGEDAFDELSASRYPPRGDGSDGYVASKWASERILERTSTDLDLPVWIYRPSSITGAGAPPMDVMQNVLKFSRDMCAVPDLQGWEGFFDFIDVERVAKGIVGSVVLNRPHPMTRNQVEYVHASGETVVPVEGVKEHLERETGKACRVLGMGEWVAEAKGQGLDELVGVYLGTLAEGGEAPHLPRLRTRWKHFAATPS